MTDIKEETGKSLASKFKHKFVYMLIGLGGRGLAYAFLYPLVLAYCLKKSVRDKSRAYINRRFKPEGKAAFFKHTYKLNLTFGRTLIDRAALGILGKTDFTPDEEAKLICADLIKSGKGIIMITAHAGCWQSAVNCMSFLNKPMNILYYRNPKDNDKTVAEHSGRQAPFKLINPAGPLGGVPEMISALNRGEIVCAMADRVFGNPKNCVEADFLGGKVKVPYSFYRLAAVTGAPVVTAFFPWCGKGRLSTVVFKPFYVPDEGAVKQHYQKYAQQFIDRLTDFCIKYPYQFFNYFDWWN